MDTYQKHKKIRLTGPTPNSTPGDINNEMEKIGKEASSLVSVSSDFEVFLSFRGGDTRNNFVSHLYKELKTKGIHTFKDDRELGRGKQIEHSLLEAIEKSRIAIVVLSENYASSTWCLDELVKIVECEKAKKLIILPIFYKVDPSDVEEQKGTLARAFEEHQKNFEKQKVQMWRNALTTVATISGWDLLKCFDGNEASLIECIARDVSDKLICTVSSYATNFVGIDVHVLKIDEMLDFECSNVRMIGIWGTGGIGKTTIAEFIFHRDCAKFEAYCFLKNIKDKHKKDGAIALQKEFISRILSERNLDIWDVDTGCNIIRRRLQRKKVLIVLDDVDDLEQLMVLANDIQWFGPESRIIITTRDKRLLIVHEVNYIYEVPTLKEDQALQVFCLHAFKENQPPTHFLELSRNFVSYAQGLPLALKILGNSLYRRCVDFWQSEFEKLKRIPNVNIYRVLKLSYDVLDDSVKPIFLDIAFFFNGQSKDMVKAILRQCDFYPERAFTILEEKALLTTSSFNKLCMHDMIQEMGREIVREESKYDPSKRSRLCHPNDVYRVLSRHGKETTIEGISLNVSKIKPIYLKPNAFTGMSNLRILNFFRPYKGNESRVHLLEDLNFLPDELRYLNWNSFPAKSLPSTFFSQNLVELLLPESKVAQLWTGEVELGNLRTIDLAFSRHLNALPDLSKAKNIEEIILQDCESLVEFSCDLRDLQKLHGISLGGCTKLDKLPRLPSSNLLKLDLSFTAIKELPLEIQYLTNLESLNLYGCRKLTALPTEIGALKSLTDFFAGAPIKELPQSIGELKCLKRLELGGYSDPTSEKNVIDGAILDEQVSPKLPETIIRLKSLEELHLRRCPIEELPQSIEHLQNLRKLELFLCPNLVSLPSRMHKLFSLEVIEISYCKSLCSLPKLPPSLAKLFVDHCRSLEILPSNDWVHLEKLKTISLANCNRLDLKTCSEIFESAKLKILRGYVVNKEYYGNGVEYFVTGNEIPEWFQYKSCESSLTIKLPSLLHKIRGIAFCVVFADYSNLQSITPDRGTSVLYECVASANLLNLQSFTLWGQQLVDFDHVVVWHNKLDDPKIDLLAKYFGCEVQFNFSISASMSVEGEDYPYELKVKKCGVYVISDEVSASMLNSFDRGYSEWNSSEQESFGDEKFLEAEENPLE